MLKEESATDFHILIFYLRVCVYLTEIKICSTNLEIILVLVELGLELGSTFFLVFACAGSSLLCVGFSLAVEGELLSSFIVVASRIAKRGLWGLRASIVVARGSLVVAPGLWSRGSGVG